MYTDEFEGFWNVYPRKVSKLPAAKAFAKLSPDEQLAARLDVEKRSRAHWWSSDPRKIPHAATYLNAHRFEDEWQEDLVARREAQPTAAPNYRPREDTAAPMSRWKALANRIALKWLKSANGVSDTAALERTVRECAEEAERYLDGEDDGPMTLAEMILGRLDYEYGKNFKHRMLRHARN
jgi:hypothetical protein